MNGNKNNFEAARKQVAAQIALTEIEDTKDPNVYKSEFTLRGIDYVVYKQHGIEYVCEKGSFKSVRMSEWMGSLHDDDVAALVDIGIEKLAAEGNLQSSDFFGMTPEEWDARVDRIQREELITAIITWSVLALIIAGIGYGIYQLIF